jgi:hypothetical protein
MRSSLFSAIAFCAGLGVSSYARSQTQQPPNIVQVPIGHFAKDPSSTLTQLPDAATPQQIREYLTLSGEVESFRDRWIAAFDQNRLEGKGAPYWPDAFWEALREEMQHVDLVPMFVELYQHGLSKQLMQEVLDTYHANGVDHFKGSPACFKLGAADAALSDDMDKLKLAETTAVLNRVYIAWKPKIKEARAQYLAAHPDFKD